MLEPGASFSHFTILRKLGEGGMGSVYLAEDQKLGRKVALKVLLGEFFDNAERQERFKREATTAAQINHPNVMSIFDIGSDIDESSGRQLNYIVMEYVEGQSLSVYLNEKKPDLGTSLRLAEKIAAGLAAAHKLHIVHRDIKADNIIVDSDGEPKILDFGLAKPTDALMEKSEGTATVSQELTKAGKILGTVSYMSPEQARGETVDTRSDVFSFGILLYRMATGELPFQGPSQVSTLAKILETRHEMPRVKNENIPPELERIIDKCLQKEPNDRYQDTRDLVIDLRNLRRQYDSGVSDSVTGELPALKPRRKEFTLSGFRLIAAIVVILIIAAGGYGLFSGKHESASTKLNAEENSLAIVGFENKTGDTVYNWMETGLPEILLTDLAQSKALHVISRERLLDYFSSDRNLAHSHEEFVKAAKSLGAVRLLSGSFYKLGDKMRIDARLEDVATGQIVLAEKVVGDDPFRLVDSLTHKITVSMHVTNAGEGDRSVSAYVSSSPEAFKLYQMGMEKMGAQLYDSAIVLFQQAMKIDTSFALPLMRIAMCNVFRGRQQEGARYFALARKHETNLPAKDQSLLDIYANLWLDVQYDNAFAKMEDFVRKYPDDKEAHTIYGLLIYGFQGDTIKAYAQLDTALALDPTFQLALSQYSQMYSNAGDFNKAIEYAQRIVKYHPESPVGYASLGNLYVKQLRIDDAINTFESLHKRMPNNTTAMFRLSNLYVRKRQFDLAAKYLDMVKSLKGDDPFTMVDYYQTKANLEAWNARFKDCLAMYHNELEQATATGDSNLIYVAYQSLGSVSFFFGFPDSAKYFLGKSAGYANALQKIDFPLTLVTEDRSNCAETKEEFKSMLRDTRSRVPSDLWTLVDEIQELYDSYCSADTAAIIAAYRKISASQLQSASSRSSHNRSIGKFQVLTGKFKQGRDLLKGSIEGQDEVSSASTYLNSLYYLARAEEGLGNKSQAVAYYRQIMDYWGKADIQIDKIKDARDRLARLTA